MTDSIKAAADIVFLSCFPILPPKTAPNPSSSPSRISSSQNLSATHGREPSQQPERREESPAARQINKQRGRPVLLLLMVAVVVVVVLWAAVAEGACSLCVCRRRRKLKLKARGQVGQPPIDQGRMGSSEMSLNDCVDADEMKDAFIRVQSTKDRWCALLHVEMLTNPVVRVT